MHNRHSKYEFFALLAFLLLAALVLTNGFVAKISAQGNDVDVFAKITPIGSVLQTILDEYVKSPEVDSVVEGALVGMMNSLDRHSSYIPPEAFQRMKEDTKGEFVGIGVKIQYDDQKRIVVFAPLPGSPAAVAGVLAGDIIRAIDAVVADEMTLEDAAKRIRGPRGTVVTLTVERNDNEGKPITMDLTMKRDKVELESITEARVLDGSVGYIRISDFKDNTARDLTHTIDKLVGEGMKSLVLDLRWNSGGLLSASREVCDLFLPRNTLVTYTQGRQAASKAEDMKLFTEKDPVVPEGFPVAIITNGETASSSEIVTGAMQFWKRAIVVGQKTYGKGSVQTIIPLSAPTGAALRLTTALYYTPADVTIDGNGIRPDVEVEMTTKEDYALRQQMFTSYKDDPGRANEQNHGTISGDTVTSETIQDTQLQRAVEILLESTPFDALMAKYHKDIHETQVQAAPDQILKSRSAAEAEEFERLQQELRELQQGPDEGEPPTDEAPQAPEEPVAPIPTAPQE
jgi:carboxyl-terminal processing protease